MSVSRRQVLASVLAAVPAVLLPEGLRGQTPLTAGQGERLKKLIPRTFAKLQRRETIYAAVFGDDLSTFFQQRPDESSYDAVFAWHGRLLDRLGGDFYYHGGVIDLEPHSAMKREEAGIEKQWKEYVVQAAQWEKLKKGPVPVLPGPIGRQKEAPMAVFSVNDLLRRGLPASRRPVSRSQIYLRNFARDGAVAIQALEPLTSEVFLNDTGAETDLVLIGCGGRDALNGVSLASFRAALEKSVALCREKGADVILAAMPPSLEGGDARTSLGRARPYAGVMRAVAEAAGVFFADLGNALLRQPSDLINLNAEQGFNAMLETTRRHYDHPGAPEAGVSWHPNAAAHRRMGETAARWLIEGEPEPQLAVSASLDMAAGVADEAVLTVRLANRSEQPVGCVVCPLALTGYAVKAGTPDTAMVVSPGKARRVLLPVVRAGVGGNPQSRGDLPPGDEGVVRGALLVCDDGWQQLVDFAAPVQPVGLLWPEEREDGVAGDYLLEATVVNGGSVPLEAVATVRWRGTVNEVPVKLAPGARQPLPLRLALPDPAAAFRFKESVRVEIPVAGKVIGFERSIEGVRHGGLNQLLPLVPLAAWGARPAADPGVFGTASVQADLEGIYFIVEVPPETVSDDVAGKPWAALEVQMDGRGEAANGTFGCIGKIAMDVPREDGPVKVKAVRPAAFGEGYAYQYHPDSFRARVETRPDGTRRIEFTMKRGNLVHHEWSLDGSGQSDLGINVRIFLCEAAAGGLSAGRAGALAASGFSPYDGRSLTAFELRANPAVRWSLRVF